MTRERFLYFLFNRDKKPLYISSSGFVTAGLDNYLKADNSQPANLEFAPTGWQDFLVKYARNILYWGINRDMTVPMTFVRDGFRILKYLAWAPNGGTEAVCYLGIMKLNELTLPYKYEPWYFSEINFAKINQNGFSFKTEALDGGMNKVFKAFENTKYEIDISNHPNAVNVLFDGLTLLGKQTMLFGEQVMDPFLGLSDFYVFTFLLVRLAAEGSSTGLNFIDSYYDNLIQNDLIDGSNLNYFLDKTVMSVAPAPVRIHGVLNVKLKTKRDNTGISLKLTHRNGATGALTYYWIYRLFEGIGVPFSTEGQINSMAFDYTIPMQAGDKIWADGFIGFGTNTGRESAFEILKDSEMSVEYEGKGPPSYAKGLYPKDVLEEIAKKMVGDKDILSVDNIYSVSDWLSAKKDCLILSGESIRQLPNAKLNTSIKEFFTSLNHFSVGLEIKNQKIRIEPWSYFMKDDVVLDLGEVTDAYVTKAEDQIHNTIKVGGPEKEYDDVNGKFETNQLQTWANKITRVVSELDLSTNYRRDAYGFEFLRLGLKGKDTTDNSADKDGWMLNIETEPQLDEEFGIVYYELNRPAFTSVEGVPFPLEIFNALYTPKWTLINNADRIASFLDRREGEEMVMTNALKNRDFKTVLNGVTVDEDAPIQIGNNFGTKKFQPDYFNFLTQIDETVFPILEATPYGKVRFTVNGREWFGRLNDGSIKPADKDVQSWKLIVAEGNDLTKWYEPS